jgi:hypothetical protein
MRPADVVPITTPLACERCALPYGSGTCPASTPCGIARLRAGDAHADATLHTNGSGRRALGAASDAPGGASAPPPSLAARLVAVEPGWLTAAPPPREYLAIDSRTGRGALPARGVGVLGAAGGAGKSYLTIALALAVASGADWIGVMRIARAARTLLVSGEEPTDEIRRRLYHVAGSAHVTSLAEGAIDVLDLHDVHAPLLTPDAQPTEHAAALVSLARERGPYALVVVDPLARLAGAPIDADNVAAGALVSTLERVATAAGGLVLAVHHTSLAARRSGDVGATALRGATGLGDSARMVLTVGVERIEHGDADVADRLAEIVTVRAAKANSVRVWEPVELRRGEHGELLPLDEADRAMVVQARRRADPVAARREAREMDRAARRAAHEATSAERRRQCTADEATRLAREDEAAAAILAEHGTGITRRDWYAQMRARLGTCSTGRADAAWVRVRRGSA